MAVPKNKNTCLRCDTPLDGDKRLCAYCKTEEKAKAKAKAKAKL